MNWLQRVAARTYFDIGHDSGPSTILWVYHPENGLETEVTNQPTESHADYWDQSDMIASGRIDLETKTGSIYFLDQVLDRPGQSEVQKQCIDTVVSEFPGIYFTVFAHQIVSTVQKYYESLG